MITLTFKVQLYFLKICSLDNISEIFEKLKCIFNQMSKLCFSLLNAQPVTQILNGSYRTYILGDVGEI